MSESITMRGQVLVPGEASGEALVLDEPLSLWGGMDPETGRLIDAHHPQHDALITGRVVVMASARGSSSSSSILAEAVRAGTAPAAILLGEPDLILPIGAAVAEELYDRRVPILVIAPEDISRIDDGVGVAIRDGGLVSVESGGARPTC